MRPADQGTVPLTLPELIGQQATIRGAAPALLAAGRPQLGYGRLCEEMRAVSAHLHELGIGRGDRVAAVLPDGPETAVALFTVTATATLAPVNPALTEHELTAQLRRLAPTALIASLSQGNHRAALRAAAALGIACIELRQQQDTEAGTFSLAPLPGTPLPVPGKADCTAPAPGDHALILSTSGTTARPKLVPLTHGNVLAAAAATCTAYGLTDHDRRLNLMPLFHVQGLVGTVVACAVAGAPLLAAGGFDADRALALVEEFRPTWFSASPTMHLEFLASMEERNRAVDTSSLRFIRAGSAALPQQVRAALEDAFQVPVVESYGMTEAHQIASSPLPPEVHKSGTVGPATGSRVAILGQDGTPQPPGMTGEIIIRGPNVMHGYLDDPEANAAAFVDGWLRSGDLGWLDEDGYLTVSGRLKELINRGGEKIAPREIDEALLSHPAVREAVAFPVPHPVLQEEVAAAVVPCPGEAVDEREVREFLRRRLAPFKVPRRILLVDAIPRSSAGKVQRAGLAAAMSLASGSLALQQLQEERPMRHGSAIETALAAIWKEVLELPEVGPDEDFFLLGGNSLRGTRLLAQVQEVFGVEVSPLAMYDEASTVASMAKLIEHAREGS